MVLGLHPGEYVVATFYLNLNHLFGWGFFILNLFLPQMSNLISNCESLANCPVLYLCCGYIGFGIIDNDFVDCFVSLLKVN